MTSRESDRIAVLAELFADGAERLTVPIGDDAAVAQPLDSHLVTSVDAVVDGVHFRTATYPPRAIGHKATAAALSDLAAMGARAGEVYVAAGVPADVDDSYFAEIAAGIGAAAKAGGAVVAGGDLTASPVLWLSVTVNGYGDMPGLIERGGAQPGDALVVTGTLGRSAAAIKLLSADPPDLDLPGAVRSDLTARQFAPTPRIAAGRALAAAGATAMLDISDGLGRDAGLMATASNARLRIQLNSIPVAPSAAAFAESIGEVAALMAAASGEEYELLAALPIAQLAAASEAVAQAGDALTVIGEVADPAGEVPAAEFLDGDGEVVVVRGFEHFD